MIEFFAILVLVVEKELNTPFSPLTPLHDTYWHRCCPSSRPAGSLAFSHMQLRAGHLSAACMVRAGLFLLQNVSKFGAVLTALRNEVLRYGEVIALQASLTNTTPANLP